MNLALVYRGFYKRNNNKKKKKKKKIISIQKYLKII